MNTIKKSSSISFIAGMLLSLFTGQAAAALDIAQEPLSLADQVASNVMVMLDNSGSMTDKMYKEDFNPNGSYGGMFIDGATYTYFDDIPVKTATYTYMKDGGVTVIDDKAEGAFVQKTCTPGGGAECWTGKFLNWLTTRRIDASREVLIGGKFESRNPLDYSSPKAGGNGSLSNTYKKVANNEPSDRDETDSSSESYSHSPIPNDLTVTITSPSKGGDFKSIYDPYAKLKVFQNPSIYNKAGDVIGEFNTITIKKGYSTITFNKTYASPPVVVATAPSNSDSAPIAVRIRNVTGSQFQIKLRNWKKVNGVNNPAGTDHGDETISFIVMESGEHILPGASGDLLVKAGTETNFTEEYVSSGCTTRSNSRDVSFASAFPATFTPIVISSSLTENGGDPINTRVWDIDSSGFKLAIQEEEYNQNHAAETVGYIAFQPGTVDDTTNNFKLEAGLKSNVDNTADTITYTSTFDSTPAFVAAIQTMNDADTAALRLDSNSDTAASLFVEEELSCDSEVGHLNENVGYVALEGASTSYNLAVIVTEEPKGELHQVINQVRMGISFYRYDPSESNSNIYEGSRIQGGTLRFNIPKNPFVKKPLESDTAKLPATQRGYEVLTGYVGITPIEDIVKAVERYPSIWGTTPIAENLWEVIQYYEQDSPYYDAEEPLTPAFPDFVLADPDGSADDKARDPFYIPEYDRKLSCVNSNVLIVTDGEPFRDAAIPLGLVDYDDGGEDADGRELSDLDNGDARGHDNLDDVAYWAYCDKDKAETCTTETPTRDLRPDDVWPTLPGEQFLKIDAIGFAGGGDVRQILKDTADNAGGTAYAAADGEGLRTAFKAAIGDAAPKGTASAVSANSTRLSGDSKIYLASYDTADWSGQLRAFALDTATGSPITPPAWNTDNSGTFEPFVDRNIFSYKPTNATAGEDVTILPTLSAGIAFSYAELSDAQKATFGADEAERTARINYIRGDDTNEIERDPNDDDVILSGVYRTRTRLLGDITNSNPWFVGKNSYGYSSLPGDEGDKYRTFVTDNVLGRTDMLYVGANDGMLHAFDVSNGEEKFAYIPATVIPNLPKLTSPEYGKSIAHQYFVDGSPRSADVYYNGNWHTILVGTTGAGGRGLFALDITDPDNFDASKVLFEINQTNDDDFGVAIPEPTIARMYTTGDPGEGKWSIIMGNGYNSESGTAQLIIIDIEGVLNGTAGSIKKIDTGRGPDNGLASPVPIDLDGDRTVDVIYAGDLMGNMWKFDVSDGNKSEWKSAIIDDDSNPQPLFEATDAATSTAQPITAKPRVGRHPDSGVMVYFGTGKFFEEGDDNITGGTPQIQTFYGIRDNDEGETYDRDDLQQQTITSEQLSASFDVDTDDDGTADDTETNDIRITSQEDVDYSTQKGWYLDLHAPSAGGKGERVISQALLTDGRILFATLAPSEDPCEFGASGWFMLLDAISGGRLDVPTFDFNEDGLFTTDDYGTTTEDGSEVEVPGSGKRADGTGKLSTTVAGSDSLKIFKQECDGDSCEQGDEDAAPPGDGGRQSWRQLR